MYKNRTELLKMIQQYLAGVATPEQEKFLDAYYHFFDQEADIISQLQAEEKKLLEEELENNIWQLVGEQERAKVRPLWPRIAAAASVLLVASFAYLLLRHDPKPVQVALLHPEEMVPMNKGVVLTVAGGRQILLGSGHEGVLNTADGARAKQSEAELSYSQGGSDAEAVTHTLTNNTGKKYSLVLADGTEAYLDALSSITYPIAFKGKQRQVSISGQVYFKVKHDAAMPFRVAVKDEVIEDIGTEFNINAYETEAALKTTLIEGAVSVVRSGKKLWLKPGEQAVESGSGLVIKTADLEETTAWLQGKLIFDGETLESIMNRVARIYDVKLVWLDESTRRLKFGGSLNYSKKLSTVLNYFRKTGNGKVDFLVEGKTVKIFRKK